MHGQDGGGWLPRVSHVGGAREPHDRALMLRQASAMVVLFGIGGVGGHHHRPPTILWGDGPPPSVPNPVHGFIYVDRRILNVYETRRKTGNAIQFVFGVPVTVGFTVNCPAGKVVLGGAFDSANAPRGFRRSTEGMPVKGGSSGVEKVFGY